MSYSKTERLEIGRQIYENEISKCDAASKYGICEDSARKYMREYRDTNELPAKEQMHPAYALNYLTPKQYREQNVLI